MPAPIFKNKKVFYDQDTNVPFTDGTQKKIFLNEFNNHPPPARPDSIIFPHTLRAITFWDSVSSGFDNGLLKLIVILIASLGLRIYQRWEQTEKEKLTTQLSVLQNQMNPHFLFNTLNSIYSVTVEKAEKAADMVDKLSQMMRYNLRESQLNFVPLDKEINYIENYISLQKTRFDDNVKFSYHINGNFSENEIAPMLLIPFIENAFKHGINSEQDSNIRIDLSVNANILKMCVFNHKVNVRKNHDDHSGLGIENTRKRLRLIYAGRHLLSMTETTKDFTVTLHINLK